tara:strand:- start:1729 stop:1881 length:153 start_codon:yes stop_codon:yes gene_type:complete
MHDELTIEDQEFLEDILVHYYHSEEPFGISKSFSELIKKFPNVKQRLLYS